jgi:hypothetical protein
MRKGAFMDFELFCGNSGCGVSRDHQAVHRGMSRQIVRHGRGRFHPAPFQGVKTIVEEAEEPVKPSSLPLQSSRYSVIQGYCCIISAGFSNGRFSMDETTILYRPTGPKELALIRESDYRKFPPRLFWQPIFYPVLDEEYATQIARDWNARYGNSGYVISNPFKER